MNALIFNRTVLFSLPLFIIAVIVYTLITQPKKLTPIDLSLLKANLDNGKKVFLASGCNSCHISEGSDNKYLLTGGQKFFTNFGTFVAPNISNSKEHGIGSWDFSDFYNSIKFGPDAEWVEDPHDYSVNENLKSKFIKSINKYLPDISEDMLSPSYAGLRPITSKEDRVKRDFTISTFENHQIENLINLYGIESPGLTSSLAIARYVAERL